MTSSGQAIEIRRNWNDASIWLVNELLCITITVVVIHDIWIIWPNVTKVSFSFSFSLTKTKTYRNEKKRNSKTSTNKNRSATKCYEVPKLFFHIFRNIWSTNLKWFSSIETIFDRWYSVRAARVQTMPISHIFILDDGKWLDIPLISIR